MGFSIWAKHKFEKNWFASLFEAITKVKGFSDEGQGEKFGFKKENKSPHKKARHEGEWNQGQDTLNREKPKQFQSPGFKPKRNFVKKGVPLKESQPKGDTNGKLKGTCFNCHEMKHYSKDCPKPKLSNGGSNVIPPIANLFQSEHNCLIFLKGKVYKWEVLCLLDHNDDILGARMLWKPKEARI
jgi:hypothetical protein